MTRNGGVILCVVGAAVTMGCGGAQLVLKGPLTNQCVSAELEGCDDIAEGATLYADGNAAEGERKLARGLRANSEKAPRSPEYNVRMASKVQRHLSQPGSPRDPVDELVHRIDPLVRQVQELEVHVAALGLFTGLRFAATEAAGEFRCPSCGEVVREAAAFI